MSWISDTFALPSAREETLLREQYRSLTRLVPVMYATIATVIIMLALVFHQETPVWLGILAPISVSFIICIRTVKWFKARPLADDIVSAEMINQCRKLIILAPTLSVGFGLVILGLMAYSDVSRVVIALVLIWILAVATGFCLYSVPLAAVSVVSVIAAPMIVFFALSDDPVSLGLAPVFTVVTALVLYMLVEVHRNFATLVRANQALVMGESRVQHIAYHDPLTGLANRRLLGELLERSLTELRVDGRPFAVYCIDLDRFKEVNDTFGHAAGDELIRTAAHLLLDACGPRDMIARLGGDEFAIIRSNATPDDANEFAAQLVEVFVDPIEIAVGRVFIGGSVGVCLVTEDLDAQECLRRADMALYRAKDLGRRQHVLFEQYMDTALRTRVEIREDLREALKRGELTLHYQPQTLNGEIYGVEALARWSHPERGPISPDAFVPIAEESGLIDALGDFVMRRAFLDSHDLVGLRVAVNVSATQIRDREFISRLRALAEETAVDTTRIELEITEGVLLGDDPEIRNTLEQARALGFRIALDDFGTGYSSLSYLKDYPIDKIKIDRSFIVNLGREAGADAVVGAIIRLARALDLDIVAEGVETDAQRIRLAALGCGDIQGFLIGRPAPLSRIVNQLQKAA